VEIFCAVQFSSATKGSYEEKCDITERANQYRQPVDLIKNIPAFNTQDR
jgi:hypothetical protein